MQSQDSSTTRAFARIHAFEVTPAMQDETRGAVFLTVNTDPDRPEPEHGILGA